MSYKLNSKPIARRPALTKRVNLAADEAIFLKDRHATAEVNAQGIKQSLVMVSRVLVLPLRLLVWVYQKTLSPDHGLTRGLFPYGYCKFYPSCSAFAATVLKQQGIAGLPKIIRRLIKCRPGQACAVDLP